jgi:uncharacterized membrane protein
VTDLQFMVAMKSTMGLMCIGGITFSYRMLQKHRTAKAGGLKVPSIVQTQPAAAIFGIPNSLFGLIFYGATFILLFSPYRFGIYAMAAGAGTAAIFSLYLAYQLIFRIRLSCVLCWMSHVINLSLAVGAFGLVKLSS